MIEPLVYKAVKAEKKLEENFEANGKITIREPKPGSRIKITRHLLKDWGDGEYTLYPNREGIPFFMTPVEAEDGHQD